MSWVWISALLVFFLGAAVGSFLNVLIYRTNRHQDWVKGNSRCEHCGRRIAWYENIPVLSFLVLRGRCTQCRRPIDVIHPVIELLTASLFLWWYTVGFLFFQLTTAPLQFIQPLFWLAVGVISVAIVVSDFKHFIIPRWTVAALTVLTILYRVTLISTGGMQLADFLWSIVWAVILTAVFFGLWWATKGKGFGFGDVQLAFPLGLLLGSWQRILVGILAAFIIGAIVGVALVFSGRKQFNQPVPFGPFLLLGTFIGLGWGYAIWEWYVRIIGIA